MGQSYDSHDSQEFDGYHYWMGIPKGEQPPHHYRLLGVPLFEDDLEVIANGADSRLTSLRRQQTGPHADLCNRLLNEVSQARLRLLNLERKAAYDQELNAAIHAEPEADVSSDFGDELGGFNVPTPEVDSLIKRRSDDGGSMLGTLLGTVLGGVSAWLLMWHLNLLPKELVGGGVSPPLRKNIPHERKKDQPDKKEPVGSDNASAVELKKTNSTKITSNNGDPDNVKPYLAESVKDDQNPFGIEGRLIEDTPKSTHSSQAIEPVDRADNPIPVSDRRLLSRSSELTFSPSIAPPTTAARGGIAPEKTQSPVSQSTESESAINPERDVVTAVKKHEQDCRTAANVLLRTFDKVSTRVRGNRQLSPGVRAGLLASLDLEKSTFEQTGCVPFSPTMRLAMMQYMAEVNRSEKGVYKTYDLAITAYTNAKDPQKAATLLCQKHGIPRVVGKWQCEGVTFRGRFTYTLYSNFSANPVVEAVNPFPHYWFFKDNTIVLIVNTPSAPAGGFKDTWTMHEEGQKFDAKNQLGGRYMGRRID